MSGAGMGYIPLLANADATADWPARPFAGEIRRR